MARDNRGRFKAGASGNPGGRPRQARADVRSDGWYNTITGIGTVERDRVMSTEFATAAIDYATAIDLWRGDDIAARVVEALPAEALREGFEVVMADRDDLAIDKLHAEAAQGYAAASIARLAASVAGGAAAQRQDAASANAELGDLVGRRIRELGVVEVLLTAAATERALGGSAILLGLEDSAVNLADPLDLQALRGLSWLTVLEARELRPVSWYTDPFDKRHGRPRTYRLEPTPTPGGVSASHVEIHESRLIVFPGTRVTKRHLDGAQLGWGDSVFTRLVNALRDFSNGHRSAAHLLSDFSQAVIKIRDLAATVASDGAGALRNRLTAVDMSRSLVRAILIDAESEDYERKATPMSGLPETLDRLATRLAAAADMPLTLLMGQSPGGLNATGASDIRFWYDRVAAYRQRRLEPAIRRIVDLILAVEGHAVGSLDYTIEFAALWQETDAERAQSRKVQADSDVAYINAGVLTPDEVALARFGGDAYSYETKIDFAARAAQAALAPPAPPPQPPPGGDPGAGGPLRMDAGDWDESQHPRAADGKFGEGGGSAKAKEEPKAAKPKAAKKPTSADPAVRVAKSPARRAMIEARNAAVIAGKPYAPVPTKGDGSGFIEPAEGYIRLYRGGGSGDFSNENDGTHGRWFTTSYGEAISYAGTDDSGALLKSDAAIIAVDVPRDRLAGFAENSTSLTTRAFQYDTDDEYSSDLDALIENGGDFDNGGSLEFYVDEETALAADYHAGDASVVGSVKARPGATVESARDAKEAAWSMGGYTPPASTFSSAGVAKLVAQLDDEIDVIEMKSWSDNNGGMTFHKASHTFRTAGYSVAKYPDRERALDRNATAEDIAQYVRDNSDVFDADPNAHVGGWLDTESGKYVLDVSAAVDSKEEALDLAARGGQAAIWDLKNHVAIEVDRAAAEARWKAASKADSVRLRAGDAARADARGDRRDARRADFDPDQARDESGRWTSGGGSGVAPPKSEAGSAGGSSPKPAPRATKWREHKAMVAANKAASLKRAEEISAQRDRLFEEYERAAPARQAEIEAEAEKLAAEESASYQAAWSAAQYPDGPDTFKSDGGGYRWPREGLPGGLTKAEAEKVANVPEGAGYDAMRAPSKAWEAAALKAMARGELDAEVATAAGLYLGGHADGKVGPLPPVLYHVATAADAIRATGIKTRAELAQDRSGGLGLGGGPDDTISFAATEEAARGIQRGMLEMHDALNGKVDLGAMIDDAVSGRGADKPYATLAIDLVRGRADSQGTPDDVKAWVSGTTYETSIGDKPPSGRTAYGLAARREVPAGEWIRDESRDVYATGGTKPASTGWRRQADADEVMARRAALVKAIAASREWAGGPMDPLFISSDLAGFAKVPRDQIQILKFKPKDGAQGYSMGGHLAEWRTWSGDAVEIDDGE